MKKALQRRGPDLAAWLGLAIATLIVCWPLGLTNRILAGVDAFTYFTPYWAHRMEAFRAGQVPLWNPFLFSGAPFLANIQAAVLYPLHWPLSWLRAEQALVWSALLHAWLAGGFTYMLATRSLRVSRLAGFVAGLIFGLGGFTLARVENINQLNGLAWLPAMLWLCDETNRRDETTNQVSAQVRNQVSASGADGRNLVSFAALTIVIALQVLAGHTQTTFINLVGLGVWALLSVGWPVRQTEIVRLLPLLAVAPALALSAAQLLPTLELNELGLRTGGLDYRTATSFSLQPRLLLQSLLPPFQGGLDAAFDSEGYAEFVSYIGITGLILAGLGAWLSVRAARSDRERAALHLRPVVLVLTGLFLALGRYNPAFYLLWRIVPGFDLFRAPARWLELYTLGAALLAGLALHALPGLKLERPTFPRRLFGRLILALTAAAAVALLVVQTWPNGGIVITWALIAGFVVIVIRRRSGVVAPGLLMIVLLLELQRSALALPFQLATAPMATALRNAPAALLAATGDQPPAGRDRFLSLSDIRYDPGDLAELRELQADRLPAAAVERLVRAAKQVEVLAPNLPLFFRLPAVDGYDGGLLPLQRYVMLQELFLPPDQMLPDGRLAEQLDAIPDGRLLDLTGVRFVITDKQRDLWAGDVYYDLEQAATVAAGATLDLDLSDYPAFAATALGVIATASGPLDKPAIMTTTTADGAQTRIPLDATTGTADAPPSPLILPLTTPGTLTHISIENPSSQALTIFGLSLIDETDGAPGARTHQSVTFSPQGDFRRIHSGDVKVYERAAAPGRAWLVHGVQPVESAAEAQAAIAQPTFAPRAEAVVEAPIPAAPPAAAQSGENVAVLDFTAERQSYRVQAVAPGLLVIADAWYPGWRATVDGQPAEILRANLLYRAIELKPGEHEIVLEYAPPGWRTGVIISAATLFILISVLLAALAIRLRALLL